MQFTDAHAIRAEYNRLWDVMESLHTRCGGEYDPLLDDLQQEVATLRWELAQA
jgi:hypothetical protein